MIEFLLVLFRRWLGVRLFAGQGSPAWRGERREPPWPHVSLALDRFSVGNGVIRRAPPPPAVSGRYAATGKTAALRVRAGDHVVGSAPASGATARPRQDRALGGTPRCGPPTPPSAQNRF